MTQVSLFLSSLVLMVISGRYITKPEITLLVRLIITVAVLVSVYFFDSFAIKIDFAVVLIALVLIGLTDRESSGAAFLANLLCFIPTISTSFVNNDLGSLLLFLNIYYLVICACLYSSSEKAMMWYCGIIVGLTSGLVLLAKEGYSSSELLSISEFFNYLEQGYIHFSLFFILISVFLAIIINPLTVTASPAVNIARWVSSMFFYNILQEIPASMFQILFEFSSFLTILVIAWWLLHVSLARSSSGLDILLSVLLPVMFVYEGINQISFYLIVAFHICGFLYVQQPREITSNFLRLSGVIMLFVVTTITNISFYSEFVFLLLIYSSWTNLKASKNMRLA